MRIELLVAITSNINKLAKAHEQWFIYVIKGFVTVLKALKGFVRCSLIY